MTATGQAETGTFCIKPVGDGALLVELGDTIDETLNERVVSLAVSLKEAPPADGLELVPTYRSLLVRYDPALTGSNLLREEISRRLDTADTASRLAGRLWRIPVYYGGPGALDLEDLAEMKDMSVQTLVDLHAGADYRVYMIGFAPGFAYLGGLPQALHAPRRTVPRQLVEAGSIGIGGHQASINSVAGPSGWRFIGQTPVRLFDLGRDQPVLLAAGDRIRFEPIAAREFKRLEALAAEGKTIVTPEEA